MHKSLGLCASVSPGVKKGDRTALHRAVVRMDAKTEVFRCYRDGGI